MTPKRKLERVLDKILTNEQLLEQTVGARSHGVRPRDQPGVRQRRHDELQRAVQPGGYPTVE
jgi:hypothetical protein